MCFPLSRRGISPLVATVLLIALVIAVANLAGPWFQDFLKGKTGQVERKSEKEVECIYSDIDFDSSDVASETNLSSSRVNITLDNSGNEPLYNFTVSYTINGSGYSGNVVDNQPTSSDPLKPGSRVILKTKIQNSTPLTGKTLQEVRVSTRVCPNLERTCDLIEEECE